MNRTASCLLIASALAFGCASSRPATRAPDYSAAIRATNPRRSPDWQVRNRVVPGTVLLIPSESPEVPPLVEPQAWMCQESPTNEPNMYNLTVRFEAPMSGAYTVFALGQVSLDMRQGHTLAMNSVGVRSPGQVVCHFAVPRDRQIEAVHVTRYELSCNENTACSGYRGIPVNAVPTVQVDGQLVANGERHSFFGAYLTMLRR